MLPWQAAGREDSRVTKECTVHCVKMHQNEPFSGVDREEIAFVRQMHIGRTNSLLPEN
jgi:hypothetical protein